MRAIFQYLEDSHGDDRQQLLFDTAELQTPDLIQIKSDNPKLTTKERENLVVVMTGSAFDPI